MSYNQEEIPESSRPESERILVRFLDQRTTLAALLTDSQELSVQWQCPCGDTVESGGVGSSPGKNSSRGFDVTGGRRFDWPNCNRKYFFNELCFGISEIVG